MFAPGSYLSKVPKLTCELKGRFQKSSPAALIGVKEDYFWNLSLALGRSLPVPRQYSTDPTQSETALTTLMNPSFRELLDAFQCPYPVAVVTPPSTKPDTPITIIPDAVYPAGTPVCDKKDFESAVGYLPENPSERSVYQNETAKGKVAVEAALATYTSRCTVSSDPLLDL
jgi:hypothetical protein